MQLVSLIFLVPFSFNFYSWLMHKLDLFLNIVVHNDKTFENFHNKKVDIQIVCSGRTGLALLFIGNISTPTILILFYCGPLYKDISTSAHIPRLDC